MRPGWPRQQMAGDCAGKEVDTGSERIYNRTVKTGREAHQLQGRPVLPMAEQDAFVFLWDFDDVAKITGWRSVGGTGCSRQGVCQWRRAGDRAYVRWQAH